MYCVDDENKENWCEFKVEDPVTTRANEAFAVNCTPRRTGGYLHPHVGA